MRDYEYYTMSTSDHFTLKEAIVTLRQSVDELSRRVEELHDVDVDVSDHEQRLRALERWKYAIPISIIPSVLAVIFVAVSIIFGRGA